MLVDVRALTKRFDGMTAVSGVSFALDRGEVLGFLGPNGAGKTTTMRMLAGFLPPSAGTAYLAGIDIRSNPRAAQHRLGYLPEGAPLYGDMTPRSLLHFVADIRGLTGSRKRLRFDEMIERLELASVIDRPIDMLSKGFKRRVGLAQALIHDPDILILDEPTDGLDPNQKHQVRALITEMQADKAIIISTHILEEVEAVCGRAVIIARGQLLADDHPDDLRIYHETGALDAVFRRITTEGRPVGRLAQATQPAEGGATGQAGGPP